MAQELEKKSGKFEEGIDAGSERLRDIKKEKCSARGVSKKTKKDLQITVIKAHCKGGLCNICVNYCPEKVLAMGFRYVEIVDPDACTKCMLCELRCPDFAIFVD
jgi:2-oxoglutarate ferredoxin oxidoreductase subunit delta